MVYFNKEKDLMLIKMVKNRRCLHDRLAPEYMDPNVKSIAWQEISQDLNMPMPEIRKRWIQLFDYYIKASNSTENDTSQQSGSNDDDRRGEYLSLLSFLAPKTKVFRKKNRKKSFLVIDEDDFEREFHKKRLQLMDDFIKTKLGSKYNFDVLKNQDSTVDEDNSVKLKQTNETSIFGKLFETTDNLEEKRDKLKFFDKQKNANNEDLKLNNAKRLKSERSSKNNSFYNETDDHTYYQSHHTMEDNSNKLDEFAKDIMNNFKNDLRSCIEEIEKSDEFSGCGPIHKFFEVVASIILMLPHHLAFEVTNIIIRVINDLSRQMNFGRKRRRAKRKHETLLL